MNITIERAVLEQALEALNHGITEMNHRGCAIECMSLHHATKAIREALAQPQPVPPEGPMAETVEQAARDVAKCLNERDGRDLDLRHVAMLANYAQQPVQEPVHFRAVLDPEQVPQQVKQAMHVCGFRTRKAADEFVAEQTDFHGWRYTIEPLYAATVTQTKPEQAAQPQPVAQPVQAMEWQPIETAPKDGTAILISEGRFSNCVEWNEEFEWWAVDDNKLGPFRLRGSAPTYWMPLPQPPSEQAHGITKAEQ